MKVMKKTKNFTQKIKVDTLEITDSVIDYIDSCSTLINKTLEEEHCYIKFLTTRFNREKNEILEKENTHKHTECMKQIKNIVQNEEIEKSNESIKLLEKFENDKTSIMNTQNITELTEIKNLLIKNSSEGSIGVFISLVVKSIEAIFNKCHYSFDWLKNICRNYMINYKDYKNNMVNLEDILFGLMQIKERTKNKMCNLIIPLIVKLLKNKESIRVFQLFPNYFSGIETIIKLEISEYETKICFKNEYNTKMDKIHGFESFVFVSFPNSNKDLSCSISLEPIKDCIKLSCGHCYERINFMRHVITSNLCSQCRKMINISHITLQTNSKYNDDYNFHKRKIYKHQINYIDLLENIIDRPNKFTSDNYDTDDEYDVDEFYDEEDYNDDSDSSDSDSGSDSD